MTFTVIIPTYNRGYIIEKTIKDVLCQTYSDFEVIVVDNGSTDNTKNIVENISSIDSRITYIYQENTGSPAGSRNTGIKYAKGDWVSFLDSDDSWEKNKLEKVYDKIAKLDSNVIAVSNWEYYKVNDKIKSILKHSSHFKNKPYRRLLFGGNYLSTSAMTVRKDILVNLKGFDERDEYFAVEDYDLWLRIARVGNIDYIKEPLGSFNIYTDNMSGDSSLVNSNLRSLLYNHINSYYKSSILRKILLAKHLARAYRYEARALLSEGRVEESKTLHTLSFQMFPFSFKTIVSFFQLIIRFR